MDEKTKHADFSITVQEVSRRPTPVLAEPKLQELLPPPNVTTSRSCCSSWMQSKWLFNAFCMFLNTIATVATVFLNKVIFSDPQLRHCQITHATWHFTATFLTLLAASRSPVRVFEPVRLPFAQLLPICGLFAGFLVLNNLSLTFNPVGFYQLAKILTTPTLVLLNYLPLGAGVAVAAFSVTALYQIWIGKKIADFKCSAPQLLFNQAPVAVMMLLPLIPLMDTIPNMLEIPANVLWCFAASGATAAMINLSQFLIIGETSALTFNIVGMLKTVTIVSLGWFIEGRHCSVQDILGVVVALGGAWVYAQFGDK